MCIRDSQEAAHSIQRSYGKLTKKQIDLLNLCSVPQTAQEIMDRLRITNQTRNRKQHINPLLEIDVYKRQGYYMLSHNWEVTDWQLVPGHSTNSQYPFLQQVKNRLCLLYTSNPKVPKMKLCK